MRVVAAKHQRIGIGRVGGFQQFEVPGNLCVRPESGDQNVIFHPGARTSGVDEQERLGVILALHDGEAEFLLIVQSVDELRGIGACRHRHGLSFQVVGRADAAIGADQPFELRHEKRHRECDLLLSGKLVGGRSAFDVDRTVGDKRHARRRSDRIVLHLQVRCSELALHFLDDVPTQLDGKAYRLLFVIEIGQGKRALAVPDGEGPDVLDLLQSAFKILGDCRRRDDTEHAGCQGDAC